MDTARIWYRWCLTKSLEYSFTAAVWLSWLTEVSWTFSKKTWKGIQDAHTETVWIYDTRNSRPWPCKEVPGQIDSLLQFYPDKTEFEVSHTNTHERHRMDDLIEATLVSKVGRFDITAFMMDVKWRGSAPSLYEMIYAYFLTQGIPVSSKVLKSCKLTVETLEHPHLVISLNRVRFPVILDPFRNWSVFVAAPASAPAPAPGAASTFVLPAPVPTSALKANKYILTDNFRRIIAEGVTGPEPPAQEPVSADEHKLEEHLATTSWVEIQREVAEGTPAPAPSSTESSSNVPATSTSTSVA